ncbi:MAG: MotA/TolQ/ExbB proton channel family protein [Kiritimatiellae bacterium]|nr:MotA/TolQ/ExbB proton channel family protein [Kiritimatiellia bacterium]
MTEVRTVCGAMGRAVRLGVALMLAMPAFGQFPPLREARPGRQIPAVPKPAKSQRRPTAAVSTSAPPAALSAATSAVASTTAPAELPPWVATAKERLAAAVAELDQARRTIADERLALSRRIGDLERRLAEVRTAYEVVRRQFDHRALDLNNLRNEIKGREQEAAYLSNLLAEYIRNFEPRLHIAEVARHAEVLREARLAMDNTTLEPAQVYRRQMAVVESSLERLERLVGGYRFRGAAAAADGRMVEGVFAVFGPMVVFASENAAHVGLVEQRLGSVEPSVEPFGDPALVAAAAALVRDGGGTLPFDASLGNARKVERTRETLWEHIQKGGAVMWPILGVAAVAAIVALTKWITLARVRVPDEQEVGPLLEAAAARDAAAVMEVATAWPGPAAEMIEAGAANLAHGRDLIEEAMFERVLRARSRFQRGLPILAVAAASAPLLGLLGTVTGIISTFKLLTVFGTGDVKMLSAGISEALITTEFGLYVAIPSLLSHSFLSRRAKSLTDRLERLAVAFLAQVEKGRGVVEEVAA